MSAADDRYARSLKGQARTARYRGSPKGRATMAEVESRYRATAKGMLRDIRHSAKQRGTR